MPANRYTAVADSGTYFTANNGATGVATAAAPTSYSDTAPLFTFRNGNANNTGRSIYLDWIRFYCTAAGTAGVAMFLKAQLDRTTPTSGTVATTYATNPNDPYLTSGADIRLLPTGIAATANMRLVIGNHWVIPTQTAVFTVNTEVSIKFGSVDGNASNQIGTSAAGITRTQVDWPPIVIPPGWTMQVPFIATTQSAASSWAFEFGYVEY